MKILKMYVARKYGNAHYYCMFDEIPEVTYEKIGFDYVGSAVDENGNVIFSEHLGHESFSKGAFGGRELTLTMKDGSKTKIKDQWWDWGHYKKHGKFISIGAGTLEDLQRCYVYCGMNINADTFQLMLDDYYSREKEYEYYEIEKWAFMQKKWYRLQIDGKKLPIMVSENGDFANMYTKEKIYPYEKRVITKYRNTGKTDKVFYVDVLKYDYEEELNEPPYKRKVRIECSLLKALKQSLPFPEELIVERFKLHPATHKVWKKGDIPFC